MTQCQHKSTEKMLLDGGSRMRQLKQSFLSRLLHGASVSIACGRHREIISSREILSNRSACQRTAPCVLTTRAQLVISAHPWLRSSFGGWRPRVVSTDGTSLCPSQHVRCCRSAGPGRYPRDCLAESWHAAPIKPGKCSRPAPPERKGCYLGWSSQRPLPPRRSSG